MTQRDRILTELRRVGESGLTPDQIRDCSGSNRAAARIHELKAEGHEIEDLGFKTASGARVARYVLRESGQLFAAPPIDPTNQTSHHMEAA